MILCVLPIAVKTHVNTAILLMMKFSSVLSYHLLDIYSMTTFVLSALHVLTYLISTTTLGGKYSDYLHFADKRTVLGRVQKT